MLSHAFRALAGQDRTIEPSPRETQKFRSDVLEHVKQSLARLEDGKWKVSCCKKLPILAQEGLSPKDVSPPQAAGSTTLLLSCH